MANEATNGLPRVRLPVCPEPGCGRVGKQPWTQGTGYYCVGGSPTSPDRHRRVRMTPKWFRMEADQ